MPDREKVMEALEHCSDRTQKRCNPTCPYHERNFCETELASDALALLKELEPVRCKDCKHWIPGEIDEMDNFIVPRCKWRGGGWSSNDYCSYAERREQDA